MTIFQQRHDGRVAQAAACKPARARSIRGRVSISRFFHNSRVAQPVERGTVNAQVARSIRASRANFPTEGTAKWSAIGLENRGCRDERSGFDSSAFRQFLKHLGSSVVERGPETSRVVRSIRTLGAILNMAGSSMVELRIPTPRVVGSIPTRHAIFRNLVRAVRGLVANQKPAIACRVGSIPTGSAIHASEADTVYVPRWIVDPEHQNHSPFESDLAHHSR